MRSDEPIKQGKWKSAGNPRDNMRGAASDQQSPESL